MRQDFLFFFTFCALIFWDFCNQAMVEWMIPKAILKQI